mgnify:CR=1 FL=1
MVTFGSRQIPTIFLQHLQNIFDFVLFHIIECFDYAGKGTNYNTFKQIFCVKSIKSNTMFYVYLDFREQFKDIHHFVTGIFPSNLPHITGC